MGRFAFFHSHKKYLNQRCYKTHWSVGQWLIISERTVRKHIKETNCFPRGPNHGAIVNSSSCWFLSCYSILPHSSLTMWRMIEWIVWCSIFLLHRLFLEPPSVIISNKADYPVHCAQRSSNLVLPMFDGGLLHFFPRFEICWKMCRVARFMFCWETLNNLILCAAKAKAWSTRELQWLRIIVGFGFASLFGSILSSFFYLFLLRSALAALIE